MELICELVGTAFETVREDYCCHGLRKEVVDVARWKHSDLWLRAETTYEAVGRRRSCWFCGGSKGLSVSLLDVRYNPLCPPLLRGKGRTLSSPFDDVQFPG